MGVPWDYNGVSNFPWCFRGVPVGLAWNYAETSMGLPWDFGVPIVLLRGDPMGFPWKEPWDSHGSARPMEVPWQSHGN